MKLKTNIFLWVAVATVIPLTVLVFGATLYSEQQYLDRQDEEIALSLDNLVSDIDRRLRIERGMITELSRVSEVNDFKPLLADANEDVIHETFDQTRQELFRFFSSFYAVVPSLSVVRILDMKGRSLAKISFGKPVGQVPDYDNEMSYAEPPPDDAEFERRLRELPSNELSIVVLPYPREENVFSPMLDTVQPLLMDGDVVGYLAVSMWGFYTDQILDYTIRPRGGELLIAELNPDEPERDGLILYDDVSDTGFSRLGSGPDRLRDIEHGRLWDAVQLTPYGVLESANGEERLYFVEYHPYPGQLVSWILVNRVNSQALTAPFTEIRLSIALFAGVALLASMMVARLGAMRVSNPVSKLARGLKHYADGDTDIRFTQQGPDEIKDLQASFNYMAETEVSLEEQRDQARKLVIMNEKLAGVGKLAAGIAHEINNPLNNILSLVKLAERQIPKDLTEVREDVAAVREETIRASQIVQGLLNFARQVPPRYADFDVNPWLQESVALVRQVALERGVALVLQEATESILQGDRNQLQQVLINLLVNAAHASPKGGEIKISSHTDEQALEVRIKDSGTGLSSEVQAQAFDPFFTTKPVGEGSGLGLAISLGIVEQHGGSLSLINRPEGGVVAVLRVPLRPQYES